MKEGVAVRPLAERANRWVVGEDTGSSSIAIWAHMQGVGDEADAGWPSDPSDLGRCLRLLALIPEWKPRLGEMAVYGKQWKALLERWAELEASMDDEVGIDWRKGNKAPRTYALMKDVLNEVPARNVHY